MIRQVVGGLFKERVRRGKGKREVKKAKATPDLVAAAEERRNFMTEVGAGELILSRSSQRRGGSGSRCLLAVKSEEPCCIVPLRILLAERWSVGDWPHVKDCRGVWPFGLSSKKDIVGDGKLRAA